MNDDGEKDGTPILKGLVEAGPWIWIPSKTRIVISFVFFDIVHYKVLDRGEIKIRS